MSLDSALRATEILLALAFIQQSAEFMRRGGRESAIFALRLMACVALLSGVLTGAALIVLVAISLWMLQRFQGPYNGGSDRMSLLILFCLTLAHFMPNLFWQEVIFGYLAFQLTLSYFISGRVKIVNPEWRSGRALRDVFAFSAYPVSEELRGLAKYPQVLWLSSWAVILFELFFPLALLNHWALIGALCVGAGFHLSNALFFGLNRFLWIWIAAYPSLLWFQARIFEGGF
jgi:HTTM domain